MSDGLPLRGKHGERDRRLRREYGLTEAQWDAIYEAQLRACAICQRLKPKKQLYTDHDHKSLRVRGLLCFTCNHRLLGRGLENPVLHEMAAIYLRSMFDGRKVAA